MEYIYPFQGYNRLYYEAPDFKVLYAESRFYGLEPIRPAQLGKREWNSKRRACGRYLNYRVTLPTRTVHSPRGTKRARDDAAWFAPLGRMVVY
jgi:hypothetical protein